MAISLTLDPIYAYTSLRRPSAVDRQRRARHRRGGAAAQEHRQRADLLRGHELARGLGMQEHVLDDLLLRDAARLGRLRDLLLHEGRQHVARAYGVGCDAML